MNKQLSILVFFLNAFILLLSQKGHSQAVPMTCPNQLIYFLAMGSTSVGVYDPAQPVSAFNPSNTNIPLPPPPIVATGITLMPNINGGVGPTFYITASGFYMYWNGSSWVNTGQASTGVNIGGCANGIYNRSGNWINYYDGVTETLLLSSMGSQSLAVADVVTDCECNFYSFSPGLPQELAKYSPNGTLLATWSLTGIPVGFGGPGFAIIGNQVYYFLCAPGGGPCAIYNGTMGAAGGVISMNIYAPINNNFGYLADIASCPFVVPVQLTGTISTGSLSCNGQTTAISVTTTNSPVTFGWSGPGIVGATNNSVVTVNTAGIYSCVVSIAGICSQASIIFTTTVVSSGPCIAISSSSISCANLGSATVQAVGGSGPFNYTWLPTGQTSSVASGLVPGTYTLIATDQNSGYTFTTITTFSNALSTFTGNLSYSPSVACNGATTGTAAFTSITGGSPNQNYLWTNGDTILTVANPNVLGAGSWNVIVNDVLTGCVFSQQFIITEPSPVLPNIIANYPGACINTDLFLTASATGGTPSNANPGYSFSWASGPVGTNYTVTQSSAGVYIYSVTATDSNSCTGNNTISVTFSDYPILSLGSISICAQNTGTLIVSGASSFTWNNGTTGSTFTDSPFTSQQYTVMGESAWCISSTTANILVVPRPVPVITTNSIACEGNTLTFNASGGVSYLWLGPNSFISTASANIINNSPLSAAGVYSVTVTAASSCSANAVITLSVNPIPALAINPNPASVCTGSTILLTANGNATSFTWTPTTGLNSSTLQSVLATPVTLQVYTVVASLNTCTNTAVVSLSVLPLPVAEIINNRPTMCVNEKVELSGTGGGSYLWKGPGGIMGIGPILNFQAFSPAYNGIYTLQVTNVQGCSDTAITHVVVNPKPSGYLRTNTFSGCVPFCADFKFVTTGTVPVTSQNWSIGTIILQQDNFSHCFTTPGNYIINGNITGANGCVNTLSFAATAFPKPIADFSFFPKNPIENTEAVVFSNTSTSPDITSFNWYFINNKGFKSNSETTSYIFENAGTYPVALVIKDIRGCSDTVVKPVIIDPDFIFYVPNTFTPNDDQKNDIFMPVTRGIKSYSILVFDRWGELIFESNDPLRGWDGTFKGEICKDDVYAWKARLTLLNGNLKNLTGFIMILK